MAVGAAAGLAECLVIGSCLGSSSVFERMPRLSAYAAGVYAVAALPVAMGLVVGWLASVWNKSGEAVEVAFDRGWRWLTLVVVVGVAVRITFAVNQLALPGRFHPLSLAFDVLMAAVLVLSAYFILRFQKRYVAGVLGVAVVLGFLWTFASAIPHRYRSDASPGSPQKPNLVLILIDTLRRDHVSCLGKPPQVLTPEIDLEATGAIRFAGAYSTSSWTIPAMASLWTGSWPAGHQLTDLSLQLPPWRVWLPDLLQRRGYETVAFVGNALLTPDEGWAQGFNYYDLYDHRVERNLALLNLYHLLFEGRSSSEPEVVVGPLRVRKIPGFRRNAYYPYATADELLERAIPFIQQRPARTEAPLFLYVHFMDPHMPYLPHPEYRDVGGEIAGGLQERWRQFYREEIAYCDSRVGRLLNALKASGILDDALLVITSDHGEEFWEHGGYDHGNTLYEEVTRVPLIMRRYPTKELNGRTVEEPVSLADLLPTIAAALELDLPEEEQKWIAGVNALKAEAGGQARRGLAMELWNWERHQRTKTAWLETPWKYLVTETRESRREELYHLQNDPGENSDLAGSQPLQVESMRNSLGAWKEHQPALSPPEAIEFDPDRLERVRSLGYTRK